MFIKHVLEGWEDKWEQRGSTEEMQEGEPHPRAAGIEGKWLGIRTPKAQKGPRN